jgi:hypothetical protein
MQHRPLSDLAISSASQGNPETSWNQKIHQRVQDSQQIVPALKQVNHGQTFR